jgi:hypothetical protein
MIHLTAASAADLGAVLAVLAVLAAPMVIALARGAEHPGLVLLLTVLGFTIPLAFIAAFALPRRLSPARPRMPGSPLAAAPPRPGRPAPVPGSATVSARRPPPPR